MEFSPLPPQTPKHSVNWKHIVITALIVAIGSFVGAYFIFTDSGFISPLGKSISVLMKEDTPLKKYSFEELAITPLESSQIIIEKQLEEKSGYIAYLFSMKVEGEKVTGQLNIPKVVAPENGYPVIVMNRGFIEPETYETGMGTKNAAGYYASNGFVTIAADFLGYGGSDKEDVDPMAARVKKVMTPLTILMSLDSLVQVTPINKKHVFMWGHSNGGQISLSVLEIMGKSTFWNQPIPTSLWAPVSSAFPYNILYYTDDFDTVGQSLRKVLYNFELKYDTQKYSIHNYLDWIDSPIQLHQGTKDDQIPIEWGNRIVKALEEKNKDITYFKYDGADHNLQPNWTQVVERDLQFFNSYLTQ